MGANNLVRQEGTMVSDHDRIESHKHDITQILSEALDHERATLREYYNLLALRREQERVA
jgi:hypothetical protein